MDIAVHKYNKANGEQKHRNQMDTGTAEWPECDGRHTGAASKEKLEHTEEVEHVEEIEIEVAEAK